jgi:hypothetical protein
MIYMKGRILLGVVVGAMALAMVGCEVDNTNPPATSNTTVEHDTTAVPVPGPSTHTNTTTTVPGSSSNTVVTPGGSSTTTTPGTPTTTTTTTG